MITPGRGNQGIPPLIESPHHPPAIYKYAIFQASPQQSVQIHFGVGAGKKKNYKQKSPEQISLMLHTTCHMPHTPPR